MEKNCNRLIFQNDKFQFSPHAKWSRAEEPSHSSGKGHSEVIHRNRTKPEARSITNYQARWLQAAAAHKSISPKTVLAYLDTVIPLTSPLLATRAFPDISLMFQNRKMRALAWFQVAVLPNEKAIFSYCLPPDWRFPNQLLCLAPGRFTQELWLQPLTSEHSWKGHPVNALEFLFIQYYYQKMMIILVFFPVMTSVWTK